MDVINAVGVMQERCEALRLAGQTIAFVPTMGFFHEGHLELMRVGRHHADTLVISIFVNPVQFGPNEDYKTYPRDLEGDLSRAREIGVNLAFVPSVVEQAGFMVSSVFFDQDDLVCDVVKVFRSAESFCEFGIKGCRHVNAIQPHLVGVDSFMPKPTFARARMRPQLLSEQLSGLSIALVARLIVQEKEQLARVDLIEVILLETVGPNIARRANKVIDVAFDVVKVFLILGFEPHLFDSCECNTWFVVPPS